MLRSIRFLTGLFILMGLLIPCHSVLSDNVDVLVILPNFFGANYYLAQDDFEQFGWTITFAGVTPIVNPCTSYAEPLGCLPITVDVLISEIEDITVYDSVVVMSGSHYVGNPCGDLIADQGTLDLLAEAAESDVIMLAYCTGVRVFAAAGIINGKNVTGNDNYKDEYEAAGATYLGANLPPVVDGNIITCTRGLYYHVTDSEALSTVLERNSMPESASMNTTGYHFEKSSPMDLETMWTSIYSGSAADGVRAIVELQDGCLVIAGYTYSEGQGNSDILLAKTTAFGTQIWSKTIGGPGWEYANSIFETGTGEYVITGYTSSYGSGMKDIYVVKASSSGDIIWEKTFGGSDIDHGMSACEAHDGSYIIAGYTRSYGAGEDDLIAIKIDADGNEIWSETYGDTGPETCPSIISTSDGQYLIAGSTGSFGASNRDIYLVKIDEQGTELWSKTHGGGSRVFDWVNDIHQTSDGGFILAGNADHHPPGAKLMDALLMKLDASGEVIWRNEFGPGTFYYFGNAVCMTSNQGYLLCGISKTPDPVVNNIYLIETDSEGVELGTRIIETTGSDWGHQVINTRDQGFLIAGQVESQSGGSFDGLLLKLKPEIPKSLGVELDMPAVHFEPGDPFFINAGIFNPKTTSLPGIPLFTILDVYGSYYFWPTWTDLVDYKAITVDPGFMSVPLIPCFTWPSGTGTAEGITIYCAMTDSSLSAILGEYSIRTFGWSE
jgi:DJ-1/PfpI family protein